MMALIFPGFSSGLRNVLRWIMLLIVGASTGLLIVAADPNSHHTVWDFIRAAAFSEIPTLAALKTTLEQQLGIGTITKTVEKTQYDGGPPTTKITTEQKTVLPIKPE